MHKYKWKWLASLLLLSTSHGGLADNQLEIPATTPEQDHIASMMEDNFYFESEHRKLANELALEELRSKLHKLQNEPFQGDAPDSTASASKAKPSPQRFSSEPKVLLVSDIAGVSRVAVAVGKKVKMLRHNEVFQANGKAYRLFNGGQHGMITIKEVTP